MYGGGGLVFKTARSAKVWVEKQIVGAGGREAPDEVLLCRLGGEKPFCRHKQKHVCRRPGFG